jgi:hypothetical protein
MLGFTTIHYYTSMDIIARQFRMDDGTVLTTTGSHIDWDADTTILYGSILQIVVKNIGEEENDDNNSNTGHRDEEEYWCRFHHDCCGTRQRDTSCFDLLRRTSRGSFATGVLSEHQVDDRTTSITFPPWFDPTNRWFPLSMYLSARYEIALWRAFYQWSKHRSFRTVPNALWSPFETASELSTIQFTIAQSLSNFIKNSFSQEKRKLSSPKSFYIRDMLLWKEFVNFHEFQHNSISLKPSESYNLTMIPILELGTTIDEIRQEVRRELKMVLIHRAMEQLLQSDDQTGAMSDETRAVRNITGIEKIPPVKQRKGKRKSSSKKKSLGTSKLQQKAINVNTQPSAVDHDDPSTSSSDIDDICLVKRMSNSNQRNVGQSSVSDFISDRQRNRHAVIALSVIEDILTNVFQQVGITDIVATVEAVDATTQPPIQDHTIGLKSASQDEFVLEVKNDEDLVSFEAKEKVQDSIKDAQEVHHIPNECDVWDSTFDQFVPTVYPQGEGDYFRRSEYHSYSGDPLATFRTSNLQGFSSIEYNSFTPGFFQPPDVPSDTNLEMQQYLTIDGWGRHQGIGRNESILTDYFHDQDMNQTIMASSTAASIASSDKIYDRDIALEGYDFDCDELASSEAILGKAIASIENHNQIGRLTASEISTDANGAMILEEKSRSGSEFHSPSPPSTPSPTLSPILVSLSDLGTLPIESLELLQIPSINFQGPPSEVIDLRGTPSSSDAFDPASRKSITSTEEFVTSTLKTSSSRENVNAHYGPSTSDNRTDVERRKNHAGSKLDRKASLAMPLKCKDDHDIIDKATVRRSADALKSYRNIVISRSEASKLENDVPSREIKKFPSNKTISAIKSSSTYASMIESPRKNHSRFHFDFSSSLNGNDCPSSSRSDYDGNEEYQNLRDSSANRVVDNDNCTVTKDGATTISSGTSQRESEEVVILREQRNIYRDMCLTLGSEVAKLKNLLAAQACTSFQPVIRMPSTYDFHPFPVMDNFDPRVFHIAPRAQTLAALSDAGYRGEYESLASEDEVAARMASNDNVMHLSSGLALNTADQSRFSKNPATTEHMKSRIQIAAHDAMSPNVLQSRLARDIFQFLEKNAAQLRQLDGKIQSAVERMGRLVKTVWPRAQVKLYGSHATGLSVVSSDLDFVVCLPAVHKNDIAVAPGALEGRNAINESSQKLLARRLKGESWIDPRSMKLIDRTAVPVIKVSTKDTKKYTLHLDISFDGPGHHGLEAAQMISSMMNELPMLRPLVVVLKQFLIERSLLEAYTGKFIL